MPLLERLKWADGRRQRFERWMHRQLFDAIGNRAELESKWKDNLERWRAEQGTMTKGWPFEGASDLTVPVTAIHADPVLADLMGTLHAEDEYWNVEPRRSQTVDSANAWREALKYLEQDFIDMRAVDIKAQLNNVIHGTAFYKSHWLHEEKNVRDYNMAGEIEPVVKTRSQPVIDQVPIQDLYFPPEAWSLDADQQGGARWVAEEFKIRPNDLRIRAESDGLFQPAYDKNATEFVIRMVEENVDEEEPVTDEIREQADYTPFRQKEIRLYEVWARFDADDDGIDEDIHVIWHQETQTILRALYNPFLHGKRPYEGIQYLPTQSIYGIGMSEIDEWAQHTLSRLVNAQIDNVLLANTRMFSAPLGSGIQPGEPIYPGKVWMHGPNEDFNVFQAGEVYPSLFQTISQFFEMSEQRTGASEVFQGNVTGLPSRTPASTTLSLLQQGSKRFRMIVSNMKRPLGRLGLRVMQNLAQYFRDDNVRWSTYFNNAMGRQDAASVLRQLQQPIHNIEEGFNVTIRATSEKSSPTVERQNFLALMQITAQIYAQIIQTAQLIEQMPQGSLARATAEKAYTAGVELLEQLLDKHDIQNPSEFLPQVQNQMQSMQAQMAQAQRQNGGPQFAPLGGAAGPGPLAQGPAQLGQLFGLGR